MTTRAYVRESTVAQGEKFGPDAQRAAITRACDDLAIARPNRWYTDLVTGTGKVVRDELRAAMAAAAGGEYDTLVCYDTSRFARNEREAFDFEDEMARAGVRIYYAAERIWSDDDTKALHKGMLHVINAEYSRALSRRVRDGIAAKRAKGGHIGGVPWGYARSADLMRIEPIEELVAIRRLAWQLYADGGHTYATVAAELNRRGHRITWRGIERVFLWTTIAEIFKSDVDVRVGGLDQAVLDRVREVARQQRIHSHVGQRRHEYVFAAVARCGECGETFWGRMNRQTGKRPYRQLHHAPRGCRHGSRNEESLEAQLGAWLQTWRLPPDVLARIARYASASRDSEVDVSRRRSLEAELERLRNLYRWADITEAEYQRDRARLQNAIAALGPENLSRPPSADAMHMATRIGDAWAAVSIETRRKFVTEWFEEIRFARDGSIDIVPRGPYRELVWAAAGVASLGAMTAATKVGTVGEAPRSPTEPTYRRSRAVRVVGLDEWRAFWIAEASA